ncbi:MAG: hypothetical protein ACOYKA_02335 [Legionellaceae bacterium]
MALSERDKIIISNTMYGYISNIPVYTLDNFSALKEALRSLLEQECHVTIHPDMQAQITIIQDYMDPSFCAVRPEDRDEFLTFCHDIITNRIQYVDHLSEHDKQAYIDAQISYRTEVQEGQAHMRRASAPEVGSERHVISEEEHLRQLQERFRREELLTLLPFIRDIIRLTPSFANPHRFHTPPRVRPEPVPFGGWTKQEDTWDVADDAHPYGRSSSVHRNRSRSYENNQRIQTIKNIAINGYTDGDVCICVQSSWDLLITQRFIESLNSNGIDSTTFGVRSFPSYANCSMLMIKLTADNMDEILEKIYRVVDALEGEHSVNEAMKTEIYQSVQQRILPPLSLF